MARKGKKMVHPYPNPYHLQVKEDLMHYLQMETKHYGVIKRSEFLNKLVKDEKTQSFNKNKLQKVKGFDLI